MKCQMNWNKSWRLYHQDLNIFLLLSVNLLPSQLAVFIWASDGEFDIYKELIELVPIHDTTTSKDILEKVEQVLHVYGLDLSTVSCLSTDDAANMVGRQNRIAAKLWTKIEKTHIQIHHLHIFTMLIISKMCLQRFLNWIMRIVWSQKQWTISEAVL